jgi:hypothetical protein
MASMVSKLISDGEVQLAETVVREPAYSELGARTRLTLPAFPNDNTITTDQQCTVCSVQQQRMDNPDFDASISHSADSARFASYYFT